MIKAIFTSRKFWYAIGGIAVVIAVAKGVDESQAQAVADRVVAIVIALIAGVAVEDAAEKRAANNH